MMRDDMQGAHNAPRIMLYSHDTFGLGHLRRSRALAQAITCAYPMSSALILTGSPVAGRFDFPARVDHVRLPGVTKRQDGSYVSQSMSMNIEETTSLRAGLIRSTAEEFQPDVLIVDKEPTGFHGELLPTLEMLHRNGSAKLVLGLRDVLDEPEVLAAEWARKQAIEAIELYYDETWIYGTKAVYDPLAGLDLSHEARSRMHWTGYLRRSDTSDETPPEQPYILITPGGGGDGEVLVDLVLAVLVYGPFLSGETLQAFERRVAALDGRVTSVTFDTHIETLFAGAQGVVCMGGYNTFCEVLSFDKRAVIVPRTVPRLEQWLRASRSEELGLIRMLDEYRDGLTVASMIGAIRGLPGQKLPSEVMPAGLMDGLDYVTDRIGALLHQRSDQAAE